MIRLTAPSASLGLIVLVALSGCHRSEQPQLGTVQGTVSYQGKPIASGSLVFEVPGVRVANAKIVDGQIQDVSTFRPNDGVPVGTARIAVFATQSASPPTAASSEEPRTPEQAMAASRQSMTARPSLIPGKYSDPKTSGLNAEIAAGKNVLTLDLP